MRGILLAGGAGTRLHPLTKVVSKHLLPVYNKPMIYYPLSNLMLMGITEIMLISDPKYLTAYRELLGTGAELGIDITYKVQEKPNGIAEAFIIAEEFIAGENCALILGDNLLFGPGLGRDLVNNISNQGATILAHHVQDPSQYGVVCFDENDSPVDLIEKPTTNVSNWAIPGLYFYDETCLDLVKKLTKSKRGELEITDLNRIYLKNDNLTVLKMSRGAAWLDMGNPKQLLEANNFIQIVEERQGLEIGNPYHVANIMGYVK